MDRKPLPVFDTHSLRALWRKDFSAVEPSIRRAARYALQIVARNPHLHHRLDDDDFLGALWSLSLPLVDPAKLAILQAQWMRPDSDCELEDEGDDPEELEVWPRRRRSRGKKDSTSLYDGVPGARMRAYLCERFRAIPESLLTRLAMADTTTPTHPSIAVLAECAGLSETELRLLDFVEKREGLAHFRRFLRETGGVTMQGHIVCLAAALDLSAADIGSAFSRNSTLSALELIRRTQGNCDLEDFMRAGDLLEDLLALQPSCAESLLAAVAEPAAAVECALDAFPHLAREAAQVQAVLAQAACTRSRGVNAFFYGPPGSGKTQFASAIAHATGLQAYQVKSADDDGQGLSRSGRLGACQLVLRLLKGRHDCVIVFDEVEDVFGHAEGDWLALLGVRKRAGKEKGWMNRLLEENPIPMIWITNDAESMDPAFLRRFLLPVAFTTPPRRVRRQMIERHLGHTAVAPEVLDAMEMLTAGDFAIVVRQRRLLGERITADDFLRRLIMEYRHKSGLQAVA